MDNPDILHYITSQLDNSVIENLLLTPYWDSIKLFSEDQSWWYLRVQHLLHAKLQQRAINWKSLYPLLLTVEGEDNKFTEYILKNPLVVSILLEAGVDPTLDDNYAIRTASELGLTDTVRILLADKRVDPDADDGYALRIALDEDKVEVVELLVQDPRVDVTADNNYAIRTASELGYTSVVKILLADSRVDPSADDNYAIGEAARRGHSSVVRLLLADKRVDPSANNNYAIGEAAKYNQDSVVKLLLTDPRVHPSDPNNNAVVAAAGRGGLEALKILLADPRANTDQGSALVEAAHRGYLQVIQFLLADPRVDPSEDNNSAIRIASGAGHTEIVKLLLADDRVDPSDQDNSALILASGNNRVEVVKLLLADERVDPSARGDAALIQAVKRGYAEVIKLLLADERVNPTSAIESALYNLDSGILNLLLNDERTVLVAGVKDLLQEAYESESIQLLAVLSQSRAVDLQRIEPGQMRTILLSVVPKYCKDALDGCIALSRGKMVRANDVLKLLASNDYTKAYYYIFLREIILKRENVDLKYFFRWLLDQCERHADVTSYRRVIAEAAKSYRETGRVEHTSPLFTAYSGFLLLAKSNNARVILNTLTQEGASEEGLQLAGMLIGAYLGKRGI